MVIGGWAVGLYGYVRPTKDLDIWVATDPASLEQLKNVLVEFGFTREAVDARPLFDDVKHVLRIGVPPDMLEVISSISGVSFEECYANHRVMDYDGIALPVIDIRDLIRNKRASGRDSDNRDASKLAKTHGIT